MDESASPRRRRKGVTDPPKKSMYDTGYFEEEESVKEVSTRARRTRKGISDTSKPNLDRQMSKQSLDDLSRKDKGDGTLKRRGTQKKMDHDKAKASAGKDTKDKKLSDVNSDQNDTESIDGDKKDEKEDPDNPKLDEKNVVFCMWGHENCRTRSHYRYNWQWDYVQKYAEQNNKHMVHGFVPKDKDDKVSVRKMAQDAERKKEEERRKRQKSKRETRSLVKRVSDPG